MIDFRYHLVSIVAIFLALTVGIVLGTTMLQDPLLDRLNQDTAQLRDEAEELRQEKDVADRLNAGADELIGVYSADMLADQLTDVSVVLLESPGVAEGTRKGVVSRIEQAGGTVTGRLSFTEAYTDPETTTLLGELTAQLAEEEERSEGDAYHRAGTWLARAVLAREETGTEETEEENETDDEEATGGDDTRAVLSGFEEAGLVGVTGEPEKGADLGIVLAPAEPFASHAPEPQDDDAALPGNTAFVELARALNTEGSGVVLAGGPSAIGPNGLITRAREEQEGFTTVDTAGETAGDVVTVLAAAITTEGRNGHYGIGEDADAFLPEPLPHPNEQDEEASEPDEDTDS